MSLKNVLYKKYGIMISEAEASYYTYLLSNSKKKYDYLNVLNEFIDNCTTRYFGKNKVKVITKELIKEEIGRDKHTPMGKGAAPNGKGAAGNITAAQLLGDAGTEVQEDTDTVNGKGIAYIRDDNGNSKNIPMEPDELHVFTQTMKVSAIAKS